MSATTYSTSFMRRGVLLALVLLCMLSLGLGETRAQAPGSLDFTLKNRLGVTIRAVYTSPHQASKWEEDVLGDKVLGDGQDITIRFNAGQVRRGDIWDLKVVTSNNQTYEWTSPGFNLTKISEITVFLRGGKATASSK